MLVRTSPALEPAPNLIAIALNEIHIIFYKTILNLSVLSREFRLILGKVLEKEKSQDA